MSATATDRSSHSARSGYLLIALAAALWGTLGIASRVLLDAGVPALELSFWRATLGGALFAIHSFSRSRTRVESKDRLAVVIFSVVGVAAFYLSYLFAVRTGGAALASILLYTAPAWVAIASVLWLHERLTLRSVIALTLTLAGVACVAGSSGGGSMHFGAEAVAWGLGSGLAYASYYVFGRRYFNRYEPATLYMYALPFGALLLLPFVHFHAMSLSQWGLVGYLAGVPTYLALRVYGAGIARVEATRAVTVATLEPVVAASLAYAVWGERLGLLGYAGAALVLVGVVVMSWCSDAPLA